MKGELPYFTTSNTTGEHQGFFLNQELAQRVLTLIASGLILFCTSIYAKSNSVFTDTTSERPRGTLSVELSDYPDNQKPRVHTVWNRMDGMDNDDKFARLAQTLKDKKNNGPIRIFTNEDNRDKARYIEDNLRQYGIPVEVIVIRNEFEKKLIQAGQASQQVQAAMEYGARGYLSAREANPFLDPRDYEVTNGFGKRVLKGVTAPVRFVKERAAVPSRKEFILGTSMGSYKAYLTQDTWINAGLDPVATAALITGQIVLGYTFQIGFRTMDNIFNSNFKRESQSPESAYVPQEMKVTENGKETIVDLTEENKTEGKKGFDYKQFAKRVALDLTLQESWRALSGPVGTALSAFSWAGQGQLLGLVGINGGSGAILGTVRSKVLGRDASLWMGFNTFLSGTAIMLSAQSGEVTFLGVPVLLAMVINNLGTAAVIKLLPKQVEWAMDLEGKAMGLLLRTATLGRFPRKNKGANEVKAKAKEKTEKEVAKANCGRSFGGLIAKTAGVGTSLAGYRAIKSALGN